MTTKTTLLAATAVAAMAFAGAASAGTITGSVNGVATTAAASYTIASERTDAVDTSAAGGFVVTNTIANGPAIGVGNAAQTYLVTFDITGGTIPVTAAASVVANQTVAGGGALVTSSFVQGARSATSISFIVTVNAPTGVGSSATLTGFTLTTDVRNSAAEASIAVASTTQLQAGGVSTTIDTTAATILVRYASLLSPLSVTSNNAKAALPDFKLFSNANLNNPAPITNTGPTTGLTAELATDYKVAATAPANSTGVYYAGLAANTQITAAGAVNGGTLVLAGAFPANLTPALSTGGTLTKTANAASFALDNTQADAIITGATDFTLSQVATAADQVAIPASTYTTTFNPTFIAGYTASAAGLGTVVSGAVALDGTNFIAPWFSGSQAQSQSQVRLSNTAATNATVRVSITNGVFSNAGVPTTFGDAVCATGPFVLPVNGDLVLSSAVIAQCFGAFTRGDLLISVEGASGGITAKMRNTSSTGTFETTLGRYSGADAASAAQ